MTKEEEDEQIDMLEQMFGIKLLSYQKELIRVSLNGKEMAITMLPNRGRCNIQHLIELNGIIFGGGVDHEKITKRNDE